MEGTLPSETRLGVAASVADEVRDERRHVAAVEQADVTVTDFVRLLLAMFRAFISDPRADAVMREWRGQINRRAGHRG